MPDGCRDIICRFRTNQNPEWFISPLFDTATTIKTVGVTKMIGFRLKAGVKFDEQRLLRALRKLSPEESMLADVLDGVLEPYGLAEEAMRVLSQGAPDIRSAAKILGVSTRTLQRRVLTQTDRTPGYWLSLSKARKCVRLINTHQSLSAIASECGYSDQSHMNREIRRWFNVTPGDFQGNAKLKALVTVPGYGDV